MPFVQPIWKMHWRVRWGPGPPCSDLNTDGANQRKEKQE